MKRILSIFLTYLVLSASPLKSQHAMGLVVGDYNSPYSYSLNPALSRTNPSNRAYINWWGASVSLENNFMVYAAPFRLGAWINESYPDQYADINGSLAFQQNWLPLNNAVDFKLNYLSEVNGPSIFIPIDEVGTFGFGVKEVSGFSVNGVNGEMGGILRYGLPEINKLAGKTINQNEFSINTEKYQEWFMNIAGIAQTDDIHVWKWGVTAKLLIGMGMAHLGSDNLNFNISQDAKSIDINQFNGRLYRSSYGSMNTLNRPLGMSFDFIEGAGTGIDLGILYENRPSGGKPKLNSSFCDREISQQYNWKIGASFTDIGFLSYWGQGSEIVSMANNNWVIDPKIIQSAQNSGDDRLNDLDNRLFSVLGAVENDDIISTTPMAFNLQFDQNLNGNIHIGAYWTQNLKRRNSVGLRRASYFNITPRWQSEQIEYGFPITVANDYTDLHMGVYGRIGPVIIGTDNLLGLSQYVQNESYSGGSFYFGVRSKIGGCDKRTKRYSYLQKETFYDTLIERDTQQIRIVKIERDTIIEKKKETTTIRDEEKGDSEIALEAENDKLKKELDEKEKSIITLRQEAEKAQKECTDRLGILKLESEKCKKSQQTLESEIKKKNAEIALKEKQWEEERQRLINLAKEKNPSLPKVDTVTIDCTPELNKLKAEIELIKSIRNKVVLELDEAKKSNIALQKKCDEEKKNLQDYLDKLQAEIALLKKAKSEVEGENKILKDQVDRLSGEAIKQPCDDKIAELEKKWKEETQKNAQIALELETEKAKARKAQIEASASEKKAKDAAIEAAEAKNQAQKCKDALDALSREKQICDENQVKQKAEIATLNAQIAALKLENEKLRKSADIDMTKDPVEDCTPYKMKSAELEAELAAVKAQLASALKAKEDCTPYKNKISTLEAELASVKSKLSASESSKEDCAPLKVKIAELEKEVETLKAKINASIAVSEDCTPYKTKIAALEAEIVKLKASKEDCTPYKSKITTLEAEISKLKSEQSNLVEEKNKVEIALEEAKKSNSEISVYTDEITKLKAKIEVLEKEKASTIDCEPIKAELEKLKAALAICQKEKASLVDPKPLQDEISKLKSKISILEEKIATGSDCKECESELAKSKAALSAAEAKIKALEVEKAKLASQVEELKQQNTSCLTLKAKNDELTKKVSELEARASELEIKLAAGDNSAELTAEINRLKEEIKKKDNQISGCTLISDKCAKKLSEIEAKLAETEKAKNLADSKYEDLKRQIISMDEDMGKLGEIIKTNNAEISKLNAEISTLKGQLKDCETKLTEATSTKEETPN